MTVLAYRPLPLAPLAAHDDDPGAYGDRLFLWLLGTAGAAPECLTDSQLVLAAVGGIRASAGQYADARVYDRLAAVRRHVLATQTRRAREAEAARLAPPAGPEPTDRPNAGPMAPLQPAPLTQPPSPAYATVRTVRPVPDIAF